MPAAPPLASTAPILLLLGLTIGSALASERPTIIPASTKAWLILYSPGMPDHPIAARDGWYFDFPKAPGSVHYVLLHVDMAASTSISARITVETKGDPVFDYKLEKSNTCNSPARVRFLLQRRGDDLSGKNGKQYYRWWSIGAAYELAHGSAPLTASLTDTSQWTSVFGERADASAAATAGFHQALANLGNVGFTFGGGCFYGHGVRVSRGTARFIVHSFAIQ
jgi:hypothetical protein